MSVMSRTSKRFISISQTSIITTPTPIVSDPIPHSDTLSISSTILEPHFQILGQPASLLSVELPPSVPVHIRKGALISLYSKMSTPDALSSRWELISFWKSLLYGGFANNYQEIVSTVPYNVLISSVAKNVFNKRQVSQKSIVAIALDGRVDWAVLPKNAIQAFCTSSLNITLERIPKWISSVLANSLQVSKSTLTGLYSWHRAGYSYLSGRGQVALSGDGQIYRIILSPGEEYLVDRDNILLISVNGVADLANCVVSHTLPNNLTVPDEVESVGYKEKLINLWRSVYKLRNSVYDSMLGNNNYVKIIGPRNVLVQTNSNSQLSQLLHPVKLGDEISKTELQIKSAEELSEPQRTSASYLKIATVKDGKVEFKSTLNFQDAVDKITRV